VVVMETMCCGKLNILESVGINTGLSLVLCRGVLKTRTRRSSISQDHRSCMQTCLLWCRGHQAGFLGALGPLGSSSSQHRRTPAIVVKEGHASFRITQDLMIGTPLSPAALPLRSGFGGAASTLYRGYSKLRTHTALGPYGRSIPSSIGPSYGRRVSSNLSNPCRVCLTFRWASSAGTCPKPYTQQGYLTNKKTPPPRTLP